MINLGIRADKGPLQKTIILSYKKDDISFLGIATHFNYDVRFKNGKLIESFPNWNSELQKSILTANILWCKRTRRKFL